MKKQAMILEELEHQMIVLKKMKAFHERRVRSALKSDWDTMDTLPMDPDMGFSTPFDDKIADVQAWSGETSYVG